jgi:hypothetical protein
MPELPRELLWLVVELGVASGILGPRDLAALRCTCRTLRSAADNAWKLLPPVPSFYELLHKHYGELPADEDQYGWEELIGVVDFDMSDVLPGCQWIVCDVTGTILLDDSHRCQAREHTLYSYHYDNGSFIDDLYITVVYYTGEEENLLDFEATIINTNFRNHHAFFEQCIHVSRKRDFDAEAFFRGVRDADQLYKGFRAVYGKERGSERFLAHMERRYEP